MLTLEQLKARKAMLEARIAKTKVKQAMAHRRADLHLKAALGGGVLIAFDLPPLSRTKSMELSSLILENGGYEDHTIYRRADHRIPQAS